MAGSLQPNVYAGVSVTWIAALLALIMRVFARRLTKVKWWYDDYFCILAFLFATGYCSILIYWTEYYYMGKYMPASMSQTTRDDILYHSRKLSFFNSLCYATSLATSKISILSFYWRLFKTSAIRIPIVVLLCMSAAWFIIRTFMLTLRCVPTQAIWDLTITNKVCNIDPDKFFLGTIVTHFIMDLIILILPVIEVFKLRLRFDQKVGIAALFVLGTIVCVASALVLVQLVNYNNNTTQMPHDYAMYCILGAVEVNIAIVSACFPLLRPVFRRILPSRFLSSVGSSHPISRPSNVMRLTTLTRTNKGADADESSSVHKLADPEYGEVRDFDSGQGNNQVGIHTMITSRYAASDSSSRDGDHNPSRIYVRNDTVVEVEELSSAKGYAR